jgi:hypothetical protein
MPSGDSGLGVNVDGLRERLPHQPEAPVKAANVNAAQDAVKVLNDQQAKEEKDEKDKKTFGRTPDGTGAYSIPSSSHGCRGEHVWDSKYTYSSKQNKPTRSSSLTCLITRSLFQLTILMP